MEKGEPQMLKAGQKCLIRAGQKQTECRMGMLPEFLITLCMLKPLFQASASAMEGLAALRKVNLAEGGAGLEDVDGEGW